MSVEIDPKRPRILVALGGRSSEREVSISSGRQVAEALERLGYQTGIIDIGTGKLLQTPELDTIEKNPAKLPNAVNFPLIDISRHFSLVFIAMHGRFGEDGGLQALLDEIDMRYTGSGALSSALAMNKHFAKIILKSVGITVLEHQIATDTEAKIQIEFPVVIKPNNQGSSVGVSICENEAEAKLGLKLALEHSQEAMVEPYIKGKEITAAILEDNSGKPQALPVTEIIPQSKFFDYKAKYDGTTQEIVPAKIPDDLTKKVQDIGIKAHLALGCRHFSRVDMIVDNTGKIYVWELNSIPGLTPESLFPRAAKAAGLDFDRLVDHLTQAALK